MIYADIGFGCNRSTLPVFQDSIISENICTLNPKQRQVFEIIHKWSRDYGKNLSSKVMKKVKPFHIFLTGGGGVVKSHLIKTICQLIKYLCIRVVSREAKDSSLGTYRGSSSKY